MELRPLRHPPPSKEQVTQVFDRIQLVKVAAAKTGATETRKVIQLFYMQQSLEKLSNLSKSHLMLKSCRSRITIVPLVV